MSIISLCCDRRKCLEASIVPNRARADGKARNSLTLPLNSNALNRRGNLHRPRCTTRVNVERDKFPARNDCFLLHNRLWACPPDEKVKKKEKHAHENTVPPSALHERGVQNTDTSTVSLSEKNDR